jgi:ParB-like chromosome segregation protein Spo0J
VYGAFDAVAASIREFGVRQAIVVDTEGVIICGHTRFKAAQKLGLDKLPVHVAKDLEKARGLSPGNPARHSKVEGFRH